MKKQELSCSRTGKSSYSGSLLSNKPIKTFAVNWLTPLHLMGSHKVVREYILIGWFQRECYLFLETFLSRNLPRTTVNKTSSLQTHKVLSVFIKLIKMSNCVLRWKYCATQPTPTWRHLIFSLRVSECFVFVATSLKAEAASALPESSIRSLVSWLELQLNLLFS